ncbi:unnamed protein product [Oikopleura dioica]|uniref:DNA mismatch repair protein S5 domain-containing protein n=1 Tax=Oikopleura dioica TaxID=34765 RepID=E4YUY5_OIKDI|nr:unnamed protein product [Oikopleura dioica]
MNMRQKSYNPNETFAKIADVIRAYSIHYEKLNFSLFRIDKSQTQVRSWNLPDRKTIIEKTFSKEVSSNILTSKLTDEEIGVDGEIFFTSSVYCGKKFILLIFINNRLIESKQIKQIIESIYEDFLPRGSRPWVYINITMPGRNIDVNVHPTKMEVQFLHDERIYDLIKKKMDMFLIPTKTDRTMSVVPTFLSNHETSVIDLNEYPTHQMVRNDNTSQKIDSFLANIEEIRSGNNENKPLQQQSTPNKKTPDSPDQKKSLKRKFVTNETINGRAKRKNCNLRSMMLLYDEICGNKDVDFKNLLDTLIFVGFSSSTNIIVQSQENLLSMDFSQLSEDLFYQIIIRDYSNFDVDEFETPIDIPSLLQLSNMPPEKWERLLIALKNMREMLLDYFGIRIDENYNLSGMPKILDNYRPEFNKIYKFFEELEDTNWNEEGKCLKSITKALAKFYSFSNYHRDELEYLREVMENTVFPIFKSHFFMPQLSDDFSEPVKLTSLPALYKVFERC